jgi:glycosyltransferase involved in cell wall biosynthesis
MASVMDDSILHMPRFDAVSAAQPLFGRKVLMVVENLPLPFDRRVWHECLTLKAAGAQVCIICPTGKNYEEEYVEIEGIHIYRHNLPIEAKTAKEYFREYSAALWHETRLAWKIFFKHGFDTIQGCNPPDFIWMVALPFKLFGVRYIFDHHDICPELYEVKFGKKGFLWRAMRFLEDMTFRTANVVIASNESLRIIAEQRGRKKPENVFVVHSGPDLNRLKVVPPNPAWRNGREAMVGYVGVIAEQEGMDLLLPAVREIVDRGRDVQFVIVGSGPGLADAQQLAVDLGVEDYVTFTGRAPDADLFEILSTADVCVNPDSVNPFNDKSTMNKILEYMAFSRPVVQFDMAEGRNSAKDASLYAAPNDPVDMAAKILELIDDPARREWMGAYGRQRVEAELSWNYQVDELVRAYRRVKEV